MSIYLKLFEAKKEIGAISKDSKNPFYKSKYFDINQLIEHVEPILQKHGLLVLQPILENSVVTQIIDSEDFSMVTSEMALTNITDPQKRGSEITYYRRYTLGSLLALQAVDDDANMTVKKAPVLTEQEIKVIKSKIIACKDKNELTALYKSDSRIATNENLVELFKTKTY